MWSLYVGRPWGISIRDISVARPSRDLDRYRGKMWQAVSGNRSDEFAGQGILDPLEACTNANITLCEMMRRINRTL
jgi:hypothetical protein